MMSIIPDISVSMLKVSSLISSWPTYSLTLTLDSCRSSKSWLKSVSLSSPHQAVSLQMSCIVMDGIDYWASTHVSFHLLSDVTKKKGFRTSSTKS